MPNQDVIQQEKANAAAKAQFEADRQRTNAIQRAAKDLRQKGADLFKTNVGLRKEVAAFKEICGADMIELRATNEALAIEQAELRKKLALLKSTAGVA